MGMDVVKKVKILTDTLKSMHDCRRAVLEKYRFRELDGTSEKAFSELVNKLSDIELEMYDKLFGEERK